MTASGGQVTTETLPMLSRYQAQIEQLTNEIAKADRTSGCKAAAPMSAPGAGANADPYAIPWTPEQEKRKRLQDAQIMRDNLLANNVGMPTTEDVVKLGQCDDVIKQLTQELGLGDKKGARNVASPMSAPETKPFVPTMTEPIQRYGQPDESGSNSDPYAIQENRQTPYTNPYYIP